MLELKALHHLSFTVPDLAEAMGFWRDLLGFATIDRPDFGFPGAWLRGHGVEVHLLALPGGGERRGGLSAGRNHVAFRVDDLEGVRRRLIEAGLEVLDGGAGIRQIFVESPGSNVIEFIAPA